MTSTKRIHKCEKCLELRELPLHLHELALFSEFLRNTHPVYELKKVGGKQKVFVEEGSAHTINIAKWLRLGGQIEKVELNLFQFEYAHMFCEPVGDMLDSNTKHYESIITPLTQFMYVTYALEECYRFTSPAYKKAYELLPLKSEYMRDNSAQAAYLLSNALTNINLPTHYDHLVDNFLKIVRIYADEFHPYFDIELDKPDGLSYGLYLVRNIRNQIAHGDFPIIEDPEFRTEFKYPHTKRNIINLLGQASRIAAINIQMLLAITSEDFKSDEYEYRHADPDCGEVFAEKCSFNYLLNLHLTQEFGLNESDYSSYCMELKE